MPINENAANVAINFVDKTGLRQPQLSGKIRWFPNKQVMSAVNIATYAAAMYGPKANVPMV
ncbi:MAG: hypothetical protein EPO19_04335 [Betaproteobacteria bacterium]|nr:MAG: hypothetical protein EPO19_04335 [Betaproteobacteria bacterium]